MQPSISAGAQPYRTLVSYKETRAGAYRSEQSNGPEPIGIRGSSRRPPLAEGKPENALTGTMFQVDSYRSDAITIPYDDANLRFWRNTSVANLQPGQTATLDAELSRL